MLEMNSIGKTPACHYLVRRLNEIEHAGLTRACMSRINTASEQLADLETSKISPKTLANVLRLMRQEATQIELDSSYPDSKFVSQLVRNVIIGKIKHLMRAASVVRKIDRVANLDEPVFLKRSSYSYDVEEGGAYQVCGFTVAYEDCPEYRYVPDYYEIEDPVTADLLHARSFERCKRQGKPHTQK